MQPEPVYQLVFDLVKIAQIGLFFVGVYLLFLLRRNLNKNRYSFIFITLLLLGIANSYILKFTNFSIPNFIILYILIAGPTLLFHIREYQMVGNASINLYQKHLYLGIVVTIISLFSLPSKLEASLAIFSMLHFGYYLIRSVNAIASKKAVAVYDSKIPIDVLKKRWKRDFYLLIAIFFIYIAVVVESLVKESFTQYRFSFLVMFIITVSFIIWLLVLRVREVFRYYKNDIRKKNDRYKNSILSKDASRELSVKLNDIMSEQKLYLDGEISLKSVAERLKVHPKVLSQAINENLEGNFFDYINSLRIEDAKKMLIDPFYKEYKIYEIMYEVGFNSRSSFNTAFKKNTSMTARQFKEKHRTN